MASSPRELPAERSLAVSAARLAESRCKVSQDSWFGADKLRHLTTSVVLTAVCYETCEEMGFARSKARGWAALSALAAGLLKEERDRRRTYFGWKDLIADVVGIALGVVAFTH